MNQRTSELTVDNQRAHTAEVENTDEHRFTKRRGRPSPATKNLTAEAQVVRKNRSAGVSPASEPRQLLLGQHDLCRLEAGATFFLPQRTRRFPGSVLTRLRRDFFGCGSAAPCSSVVSFCNSFCISECGRCRSARPRIACGAR